MQGTTVPAAGEYAHTNRLIHATSPYLLQHAHNPVHWYPWGSDALDAARQHDKPIFLSIGYAACHWCHVMERESFENERIADILNEHFVAIKVDREERPDLDEIYMNATVLYNRGQGGWPMSVFLTPDQKPFFAGTYFPPESRWGRPGFADVLLAIAKTWKENRQEALRAADALSQGVRDFSVLAAGEVDGDIVPLDTMTRTVDALVQTFDRRAGGMLGGGSNKFPPSMALSLMLRAYDRTRKAGKPRTELLEMVQLTLDRMARGGIYDHLAGGIARYSTDAQWLVPHFEKMLYDQALVSGAYLEGFQVTDKRFYADVAADIFDYVLADLQSPEGGFYSSRDADSEGVEGKYYVWSRPEVIEVLGPEHGEIFCGYYDVTKGGNWEGHNILNVQRNAETIAKLHGVTLKELLTILADARGKLLARRAERVPPGLDDKILTGWNGLMIASLARGGCVLGKQRYVEAGVRAADFILTRMSKDGRLLRTSRKGKAHIGGYLDDYAFFIDGLLELYEATFERRWLTEAIRLTDDMVRLFWDEQDGAFFFTADDAEQLLVRIKDSRDGAIPAGNSVALMDLLRVSLLLDRADLRDKAEHTLRSFSATFRQIEEAGHPVMGYDRFLAAVLFHHAQPREIVLVGDPDQPATRELIAVVNGHYDPHRVVVLLNPQATDAKAWTERIPLLAGRTLIEGRPAAYVCRNRTCRRPVVEPADLLHDLRTD